MLCVLALALLVASTLGLVHRTVHSPDFAQPHAVQAADGQGHAHEPPTTKTLVALFGYHTDADCRLYDQLAHGPAALCVPPLFLPVTLPAATFAYLEGEAIARWVTLFDARGPPATR
jgi:hypothetical protein